MRRKFRDCRLFTDDTFHFRDDINNYLTVRTYRFKDICLPLFYLPFTLHEDLPHQVLESLCQRGVWNIVLVTIKLTGYKISPFFNYWNTNLIYQG